MNRKKLRHTWSFLEERWRIKSVVGAGLAPFQYLKKHPQSKTESLYAILFGNTRREFGFTGGFCDKEAPYIAASRELFEESSGLLNISPKKLYGLRNIKVFLGIYRCYPIIIDIPLEITSEIFERNQMQLQGQGASKYHLEMKYVTYVSIDQMIQDGLLEGHGSFVSTDRNGEKVHIINRSRSVLQNICPYPNWQNKLVRYSLSQNENPIHGFENLTNFTI
jgi:hypothetical protein